MGVFAIADLHLDFARPVGREQYAERWREHARRIEEEWCSVVTRQDLVLIPGDISSARSHRDIQPDLAWLDRLPGRKVLSPGNHDRWWNSVEKIRPMMRRSLLAVEGDAVATHDWVVCGARGGPIPKEDDLRGTALWNSEIEVMRRALDAAHALRTAGQPIAALWHYPPFDHKGVPSPLVAILREAEVSVLVYGHLHNEGQWGTAKQGCVDGVRYYCVAADAIGFRPYRLG